MAKWLPDASKTNSNPPLYFWRKYSANGLPSYFSFGFNSSVAPNLAAKKILKKLKNSKFTQFKSLLVRINGQDILGPLFHTANHNAQPNGTQSPNANI